MSLLLDIIVGSPCCMIYPSAELACPQPPHSHPIIDRDDPSSNIATATVTDILRESSPKIRQGVWVSPEAIGRGSVLV